MKKLILLLFATAALADDSITTLRAKLEIMSFTFGYKCGRGYGYVAGMQVMATDPRYKDMASAAIQQVREAAAKAGCPAEMVKAAIGNNDL